MSLPQVKVIGVYRLDHAEQRASTLAMNAVGTDQFGQYLPIEKLDRAKLQQATRDFREVLERTVAVELEISSCQTGFDDTEICQPGGARYEDHYLGSMFDICYLSSDGQEVLGESRGSLPEGISEFRVVCYVYLWKTGLPLRTPFGDHDCPHPAAMPLRISELAPWYPGD